MQKNATVASYAQWGFQEGGPMHSQAAISLSGGRKLYKLPLWVFSRYSESESVAKKSGMKLFFLAAFALFVLSMFHKADSSAYDKIVAHSRIRARKEG